MKIKKDLTITGDTTCNKLIGNSGNNITVKNKLIVGGNIDTKSGRTVDSEYLTVSGTNDFEDVQIYGMCNYPIVGYYMLIIKDYMQKVLVMM